MLVFFRNRSYEVFHVFSLSTNKSVMRVITKYLHLQRLYYTYLKFHTTGT